MTPSEKEKYSTPSQAKKATRARLAKKGYLYNDLDSSQENNDNALSFGQPER